MATSQITLQHLIILAELTICIMSFSLFCSAYPDQYRTKLWQIGGERGWNSNPRLRIYFYANYRDPPEIPLIWSQSLTDTNLAISILSLAICLQRIVLLWFKYERILFRLISDIVVMSFWMYSIKAQASSDFTDPEHPSIRPWYLDHGCGQISPEVTSVCIMARASYTFAIISMIFHLVRVVYFSFALVYWLGYHRVFDRWSDDRCCCWLKSDTLFPGLRLMFKEHAEDRLECRPRNLDIEEYASDTTL